MQAAADDDDDEAVIINLHESYLCRMYNRKVLMMGREDARNV
jgi:hypothetical protein